MTTTFFFPSSFPPNEMTTTFFFPSSFPPGPVPLPLDENPDVNVSEFNESLKKLQAQIEKRDDLLRYVLRWVGGPDWLEFRDARIKASAALDEDRSNEQASTKWHEVTLEYEEFCRCTPPHIRSALNEGPLLELDIDAERFHLESERNFLSKKIEGWACIRKGLQLKDGKAIQLWVERMRLSDVIACAELDISQAKAKIRDATIKLAELGDLVREYGKAVVQPPP